MVNLMKYLKNKIENGIEEPLKKKTEHFLELR